MDDSLSQINVKSVVVSHDIIILFIKYYIIINNSAKLIGGYKFGICPHSLNPSPILYPRHDQIRLKLLLRGQPMDMK